MTVLNEDGLVQFAPTDASRAWANAALQESLKITQDPAKRAENLRHQNTWYVGVDALPNDADGTINGTPLRGPWEDDTPCARPLHRAQVSVMYPGYPKRDPHESDANHRYRVVRKAAHVDGLLPSGPQKRRFAQEFHAFVLGIQLSKCNAAPTVCWPGSHRIMGAAFRAAIGDKEPGQVDVTDAYQAARREVFDRCKMVLLKGNPGTSFLLHRFTLHGTEIWGDEAADATGRRVAFFRPEFPAPRTWLTAG